MNKKDLIDSFESLTPSDCQKDRMLNNVLSHGMEKNVHKVSFNLRHTFSTAAAALCVLAVVVAVSPMYKYQKLGQTSSQKVTTDITEDKPTEATIKAPVDEEDTSVADDSLPTKADSSIAAKEKTETFLPTDSAPAEEEIVHEEASEDTQPSQNSRMRMMTDEEGDSSSIGKGGGGAYNAAAYMALEEDGYEETTLDEYYDYLGVNVAGKLEVPEGFSNLTETSGEINKAHSDKWLFRYENNNSYIYVTTTKYIEEISLIIGSGNTDVNGTPAAVTYEDNSYTAHIVSEDIGYIINTFDVTEEEFTKLLQSIVR